MSGADLRAGTPADIPHQLVPLIRPRSRVRLPLRQLGIPAIVEVDLLRKGEPRRRGGVPLSRREVAHRFGSAALTLPFVWSCSRA